MQRVVISLAIATISRKEGVISPETPYGVQCYYLWSTVSLYSVIITIHHTFPLNICVIKILCAEISCCC